MEAEKFINFRENKAETKGRGMVDLSQVRFSFCEDALIENFYALKLEQLKDRESWVQENLEKIEAGRNEIRSAVAKGLLADDRPETIWEFHMKQAQENAPKVIGIKKNLEADIECIRSEVAGRLAEFLPDWRAENLEIVFTMNEQSNFCIDDGVATADLGRLVFKDDPREEVLHGLTHEIFHHWMTEGERSSEKESLADLKEHFVRRVVDEGLAVLVSGQSLKEHHEKKGRQYEEYQRESLAVLDETLQETDREKLEASMQSGFKDMGHFYVAGYEIARAVLENVGKEAFRQLIVETRKNPMIILDKYGEINGVEKVSN